MQAMGEQRAIDDHEWASGKLWALCKEEQPLHVRGRGARAQEGLQTLQKNAVGVFLASPKQRTLIREWLELALGEPPEYEISPTGGDACSQIEQEYATHYTQCLWDLQPPNPTGFEAKLESLKTYHHGFRRSVELQKLKEKRLQNKKKRNSESGQSERLDPEDSAPNGKETVLGPDHCTPQSENTRDNDLLQPFLAETDAVQLPQVDRFGSTVEEDASPVPVVDQQSGTPISLAIGEPLLAGDSTPVPSADAAPEHGRTSPMIDIWGDDESLTELSSDESVELKPSSKKPKFSYGAESEIDEPPRPPPPVPTRVADHDEPASVELYSMEPSPDHGEEPGIDEPESEDPIFEPSPKKPKFSYDEPSSARSPRPITMPNSDSFSRGSTARKSKPKRRNAQSRAATQPPRVSEKSRRIARSSSSTPGVDGLSDTPDRDAPGIQRVAPVLALDVEPAAPTVSSAGELDGHDAQASAGQLPPSVVRSPPTTSNGKRTKRKRTNSSATFLLDATAVNHPGETAKSRRKERSARGDGFVRIAPSQFPTTGRRAQNADLSVYAGIALEEKARTVKRPKKLRQRPGTATQDTRIAEPSRVPNIPLTDAAGLFQQGTSSSSTLQPSLPSTETSVPAGILLDDGTRLFKDRPSASTLEASSIDGTRRLFDYESMDQPMKETNALSPPVGGVGAGSSGRRWVSPTFGEPEILSSPPAEQSRRRKRKHKQVDHPASIQKQRALQRDVPVNRAATTAEEAPHVLNLQSWSREAAQKPSQTVPKGHKTAEEHAENRKDVQKERNPVKSSGIGPPEFTALDSLFRQWASPTSALFQLLNYVQEPSQGKTPSCLDVEGMSDVAQSRLPSEPVVLASSSDVFPGTDADSPQSAHSAGDDVVGGEESDATRGATTQPQSPGPLRPPKVPDTSSPPSDQVLLSPPEIPPSTRPLASIVPDEIPTVQYPRPRLPAEPQVWCMTRQELCEGTAYFRSYQGGVYAHDGLARGYMLDGYGAPRDICAHNARLIISHAGGSSHQVTRLDLNGRKITNTELKQDQEVDNGSAKCLYANWKLRKPVVLLVGKNYSLFPFDVEGKSYVILGWYRIIQMWTELESMPDSGKLFKRLKVAFQWIADQGAPFFDVPGAASRTTPTDRSIFKIPVHCHVTQDLPLPDVLGRKESIASRRSRTWKNTSAKPFNSIEPDMVRLEGSNPGNTGQAATFTCRHCLSVSPLVYDNSPMCLQGDCPRLWKLADGTFPNHDKLVYSASFLQLREEPAAGVLLPFCIAPRSLPNPGDYGDLVTGKPFTKAMHCALCGRLSCRVYLTKWVCAGCGITIPISFATTKRNHAPQSLHLYLQYETFGSMVNAQVCFLRDPLFGMVTAVRYLLADNCGIIWHLQANPDTQKRADRLLEDFQVVEHFQRKRISCTKTTTAMLGSQFVMNSGMPYHYVSEATTVSLDDSPPCVAQALEMINHKAGLVRDPTLDDMPFNEALSICYLEGQQMNYHSDAEPGLGDIVASLSLGNPASMDFRQYYFGTWRGSKELSIELRHGDVIIMQGRRIQELYQHKVTPIGLRVGVTARQIYPRHLKHREKRGVLSAASQHDASSLSMESSRSASVD